MVATGGVVVTGASSGIGKACALDLDRLGFQVFASVLPGEDSESLRQKASERLIAFEVASALEKKSVFTDLSTAVEHSETAPGLGRGTSDSVRSFIGRKRAPGTAPRARKAESMPAASSSRLMGATVDNSPSAVNHRIPVVAVRDTCPP